MGTLGNTDKAVLGQVSQKVGKVPSQNGQVLFIDDTLDTENVPPVLLTPPRAVTSPSHFTRFVHKICLYSNRHRQDFHCWPPSLDASQGLGKDLYDF